MAMEHRVIVGLGNPGKKYEMTRHNIGYLVVKALARELGKAFNEDSRFTAWVSKETVDGTQVHLILPATYMNESGFSVRRYIDYYKLPVESVVAVVDDVALAFGEMRIRTMGSSGGHNGLKSIEAHLGTQQYCRLRLGIGQRQEQDLADYVLAPFTAEEKVALEPFVKKGTEALLCLIREDTAKAMNKVNVVNKKKDEVGRTKDEEKKG